MIVLKNNIKKVYSTIGVNIIRLRSAMTQNELAKKAGVSRSTISAIERGSSISLENLIKIANALNIKVADLFITDEERREITYKHLLFWEQVSETFGIIKKQ